MGNAEHMSVHCDYRFVVNNGGNDVCGLASHSGKAHESVDIGRDRAPEIGLQFCRHVNEMAGFCVGEPSGWIMLAGFIAFSAVMVLKCFLTISACSP